VSRREREEICPIKGGDLPPKQPYIGQIDTLYHFSKVKKKLYNTLHRVFILYTIS
jgi:hypothetical protein